MRFHPPKRRGPPSVIIVSLIDVLIVVLIFMMVATTFKQQPALRLVLPESTQTNRFGESLDQLTVTIAKDEPRFYFASRPVTLDKLRAELSSAIKSNPQANLSINADKDAPWGEVVRVWDAAKEAGVKNMRTAIRPPGRG